MHAVEVSHLTKEYRLGAMQSLKQTAANAGARLLGRKVAPAPLFKALDDVSFTVEPGEVVGIIGHNGAGKSTLLKMLSRISTPTSGHVKVNGRIAPLIEVGAGFVGDFTGRENVYLNGAILGMPKKEIAKKFDEIVDFAEMAEFIDTPVKRYSSGMQVKLAFAVATSVEAEILIVDEVLAVGDLAFQRKCFDRMEELIKRQHRTVLLVSHNIRQVERLCNRVIVLDHGRCVVDDSPQVSCNFFYSQTDKKITFNIAKEGARNTPGLHSTELIHLTSLKILSHAGVEIDNLHHGDNCTIRLNLLASRDLDGLVFGIGVHTPDLLYIAMDDSSLTGRGPISVPRGEFIVEYRVDDLLLLPGAYAFRVGIAFDRTDETLFYDENLSHFQVISGRINRTRVSGQGFVLMGGRWIFEQSSLPATIVE